MKPGRILALSRAIHEALASHDGSKVGSAADRIAAMTHELARLMKERPPGTGRDESSLFAEAAE